MKIYNISVTISATETYYWVKWSDSDSDSLVRTAHRAKFDDLESANIFAFELKKNQYLLNNL